MKRSRGRGRRPQNGNPNNSNPNRTFDSNGPEIKIRGSAAHVYDKYLQMARDANTAGDRVMAENYLQHAEHYFRILRDAQIQQQQYQQQNQQNHQQNGAYRPPNGNGTSGDQQPYPQAAGSAPVFSLAESAEDDMADEGEEAELE